MNKSHETKKPTTLRNAAKAVKMAAGAAALTGLAAITPALAQAEKGTPSEKLSRCIPTRILQERVNHDMWHQSDLGAFNGALIIHTSYANGGTEATPSASGGTTYPSASRIADIEVIGHPVIEFGGNPKDESGHYDLTNGDYDFGELIRGKHPRIKLIKFDPANMELVPWSMEDGPLIRPFIFLRNKDHSLNLDNPMTSSDWQTAHHGGPLTDDQGNPWKIGYLVPNAKG